MGFYTSELSALLNVTIDSAVTGVYLIVVGVELLIEIKSERCSRGWRTICVLGDRAAFALISPMSPRRFLPRVQFLAIRTLVHAADPTEALRHYVCTLLERII